MSQIEPNDEIEEIDVGQGESLTTRLRGLVRDYPKGPRIFKEFIQNADDAKASSIRIILDLRDHTATRLREPVEQRWAGPALIICNNANFSEKDFDAIQTIGDSSKRDAGLKTGRFGVGFNVAYNVTDYPSLVSADRLIFFDPHRRHPMARKDRPGGGWKLTKGLWSKYTELLNLYVPGELQPETLYHNGTIFRFPLRSFETAGSSEIKQEAFTAKDFDDIVIELAATAGDLLVFLKFVQSISIEKISGHEGECRVLLSASTINGAEVQGQRDRLNNVISGECRHVLARLRSGSEPTAKINYRHQIVIEHDGKRRNETWQICNGLYVDEGKKILDAAEAILKYEGKALPWAGAAVKVETGSDGRVRIVPVQGRLFCLLPLPQATELPFHLNGFFDLDSSRDSLTQDNTNKGSDAHRVLWNRCLLEHGAAQAYVDLIADLTAVDKKLDLESYYAAFPRLGKTSALIEETGRWIYRALANRLVTRQGDRWAPITVLLIPPPNWPELQAPLVAQKSNVPDPPIPGHVVEGYRASGVRVTPLDPPTLRTLLRVKTDINTTIDAAPQEWLRKREWLVTLLRFCLSDNKRNDLVGLPLALLEDKRIHTFGKVSIYFADSREIAIFPNCRHWFIDSQFAADCGLLEPVPTAKLLRFGPDLVLGNIYQILDPAKSQDRRKWNASGSELPNQEWLAKVLDYLVDRRNDITADVGSELEDLPWIPDQNGWLRTAGTADTPLLLSHEMDSNTVLIETFDAFNIPRVSGSAAFIKTIRRFVETFEDENLVFWMTGRDVADNICQNDEIPPVRFSQYEPHLHDSLLAFLAETPWNNEGDKAKLQSVAKLSIFPTTDGRLVAVEQDRVYLPTSFQPPSRISTGINLLAVGKWQSFLEAMEAEQLDAAAFVRDVLLPTYDSDDFDNRQRLLVLTWLRDNLELAEEVAENNGEGEAEVLRTAVKAIPLVHCEDDVLRPAFEVYNPDKEVVRKVLGDSVHYPHHDIYAKNWTRWLGFFADLGMADAPRPCDIVEYVDSLILQVTNGESVGVVTANLTTVFEHLRDCWSRYENSVIGEGAGEESLAAAMSKRAWLPAQRDEKTLRQYFAAKRPTAGLYKPSELFPASLGHLVASQKPIADFPELPAAFRDALGFPKSAPISVILDHFDQVLHLAQDTVRPFTGDTLKPMRKAVSVIYTELGRLVSREQSSSEDDESLIEPPDERGFDLNSLRGRYCGKKCLWHDLSQTFWEPERAFKNPVKYLQPKRQQIVIEKPERADLGLAALGRRSDPTVNDLVECLSEHAQEALGNPVVEETAASILTIYRRIGECLRGGDVSGSPSIAKAPVLTDSNRLLPASAVLIADAPQFEDKFGEDELHLVHSQVDPEFIKAVGMQGLSSAITEELLGNPVPLLESSALEECRRLVLAIQTKQFQMGLHRLVQAEPGRGRGYRPQLEWLLRARVILVRKIETTLSLRRGDGKVFTAAGEREFYVENKHRIYLTAQEYGRYDYCLAHAVNGQLGNDRVADLSHLVMILGIPAEGIDACLTKAGIPRSVVIKGEDDTEVAGGGGAVLDDGDYQEEEAEGSSVTEDEAQEPESTSTASSTEQHEDTAGVDVDDDSNHSSGDRDVDRSGDDEGGNNGHSRNQHRNANGSGDAPREVEDEDEDESEDESQDASQNVDGSDDDVAGDENQVERRQGSTSPRNAGIEGGSSGRPPGKAPKDVKQDRSRSKPSARKGRAITYVVHEGALARETNDFADEDSQEPKQIGDAGVDFVREFEANRGWNPGEKLPHNHPGYDVKSVSPDGSETLHIEVKAMDGEWDEAGVALSRTQLAAGAKLGKGFCLYVVEFARDPSRRRLHRILNPVEKITQFRFDEGWRSMAEKNVVPSKPLVLPTTLGAPQMGQEVSLKNGDRGVVILVLSDGAMVRLRMTKGREMAVRWRKCLPVKQGDK